MSLANSFTTATHTIWLNQKQSDTDEVTVKNLSYAH